MGRVGSGRVCAARRGAARVCAARGDVAWRGAAPTWHQADRVDGHVEAAAALRGRGEGDGRESRLLVLLARGRGTRLEECSGLLERRPPHCRDVRPRIRGQRSPRPPVRPEQDGRLRAQRRRVHQPRDESARRLKQWVQPQRGRGRSLQQRLQIGALEASEGGQRLEGVSGRALRGTVEGVR